MNGGDALVATLISHGVDTVFCVPGESYLAVLEGLRKNANTIQLVVNRHESGASFAANAYAKIGRRPGCAFVSRGPGANNASIGVHTADQDSIPLVLFIGQVPRAEFDRESFQKVNYHEVFGSMAKAVMEPHGPEDVARVTAHALALSQAGPAGPGDRRLARRRHGSRSRRRHYPGPRGEVCRLALARCACRRRFLDQ